MLHLNEKLSARKRTLAELQARGIAAGSASQVREQLTVLEAAGLQRIMLQWLDLDDLRLESAGGIGFVMVHQPYCISAKNRP